MNLEILPNEILLYLFDYFNGIDLLRAFYGLNNRFNYLLYNEFRNYSIHFRYISSKSNYHMICEKHLPFIADRIISFSLTDSFEITEEINLFYSYTSSINKFIQLRSLSITSLRSYKTLMEILDQCHYLCKLTHLNLHFYYVRSNQINLQSISDKIWCLPKLIQCNFHFCTREKMFFIMPKKISLSLENVSIYINEIKFNEINQLFEYTPHLKSLSIYIDFSFYNGYIPPIILTLIHLNLHAYYVSDELLMKYLQTMPNLRRLEINLMSKLIDGYQWEYVIRNYLFNLQVLRLEMKETFTFEEDIYEQTDYLIKSFQTSFWINEHQWFIRCFVERKTIYLYTLSRTFDYNRYKRFRSFKSNDLHCDHYEFSNDITSTYETFFDQPMPLNIYVSDIEYLAIKLPINDQYWSNIPNFNRLKTLTVLLYSDGFQSQSQALLDRAPNLNCLNIHQDVSLSSHMSLFQYRNASVCQLNLREYHYYFDEEESIRLCHSPLGIQCKILTIRIKKRQSIIYLVQNMINLLSLYVQSEDENCQQQLTLANNNNNDKYCLGKIGKSDELVQWLKDHLPVMYSISRDKNFVNEIIISI